MSKDKKTKSNRVSLTCSPVQVSQLEALAIAYGTNPTSLAHQFVSQALRDAVDKGIITTDSYTVMSGFNTLKAFVSMMVRNEKVSDEMIKSVASLTETSVSEINDAFFWEPENEQDL